MRQPSVAGSETPSADTELTKRFVKGEVATEIDRYLPWLLRVVHRAFSRAQTPEQGAARASGPNGFTVPDHSLNL